MRRTILVSGLLLFFALLPSVARAEAKIFSQAGEGTRMSAEWHTCFRVIQEGTCHVLAFNASETNTKHVSGTPGVLVCLSLDIFFVHPDRTGEYVGFEGGCATGPSGSLVAASILSSVSLLPVIVPVERFECTAGSCEFAGSREVTFSVEFTGREPEVVRGSTQMQKFGGCTLKTVSSGLSRTGVATAVYDGVFFPEIASDDPGFVSNAGFFSFRDWVTCEDSDEFPFLPSGETLILETSSSTCEGVTDGECDTCS